MNKSYLCQNSIKVHQNASNCTKVISKIRAFLLRIRHVSLTTRDVPVDSTRHFKKCSMTREQRFCGPFQRGELRVKEDIANQSHERRTRYTVVYSQFQRGTQFRMEKSLSRKSPSLSRK